MFLKLYTIALIIFFMIDMLWLGVIAKSFYAAQLGSFMKADINWIAAIIFYLLFLIGLVVFVIAPAVAQGSIMHALIYGALFGCVTYATYDLTNLATLEGWPVPLVIVDILWGATLAALVSMSTVRIVTWLG